MNTPPDPHTIHIDKLPALVRDTLPQRDSAAVVAHVGACPQCRVELVVARRLHGHFAREQQNIAPLLDARREQAEFDRLWSRVTEHEPALAVERTRRRASVTALAAMAATLLLSVGYIWFRGAVLPDYRTLGQMPAHACGQLRVQIDPQMQRNDVARLIDAAGARIMDGPSAAGVYTLGAGNPTEALRYLRAQPAVRLAEPTDC